MLKKIISLLLISSMLLICSPSVVADEEGETLPVDPVDAVIESLDPYSYGGIYVENGQTYISAVDDKSLSQELFVNLEKNKNVGLRIAETTVQYSYGELLDAYEKIIQSMENENSYEIYETYVGQKDNIVAVGSPEWTEEKKQEISELSGLDIDHLSFYIMTKEDVENEFFPEETGEEISAIDEKATTVTPQPGSKIVCNGKASSLCAPVVWNLGASKKGGFLICAHSQDKTGKAVYDRNSQLIGYGDLWDYGGYYDSTLVERSSNNIKGTFVLPDGKKIQSSRAPKEGETIYRYGQYHPTPVSGKVISTDSAITHEGTGVRIIGFQTDAPVIEGDSGGPIMTNSSTGYYALVGLNSTLTYGVRIDKVLSKYNADLSTNFPSK